MPKCPFSTTDEARKYPLVPDGEYRICVEKIYEKQTQAGDDRWNLQLIITDGEHKGKRFFDHMTFSEACMPRVKLQCKRFGLDVSRDVELTPADIQGKQCYVETVIGPNKKSGENENQVPYAGYRAIGEDDKVADDDLPF
jgi:hypothetical protein